MNSAGVLAMASASGHEGGLVLMFEEVLQAFGTQLSNGLAVMVMDLGSHSLPWKNTTVS